MLETIIDPEGCPLGATAGMDPFADWLLGPGFADFHGAGEPVLVPCLVSFAEACELGGLDGVVLLPRFGEERRDWMATGDVLTAFVPPDFMGELYGSDADPIGRLGRARKAVALGSPIRSAGLAVERDRKSVV